MEVEGRWRGISKRIDRIRDELQDTLHHLVADLPGGFPMPIFIANMTAALLIGVLSALTIPGGAVGSGGKILLTTGIMGGLSTFSSFIWATDKMLANPAEQAISVVYLVLSTVAGFLLVESGLWLGGRLRRLEFAGNRSMATQRCASPDQLPPSISAKKSAKGLSFGHDRPVTDHVA